MISLSRVIKSCKPSESGKPEREIRLKKVEMATFQYEETGIAETEEQKKERQATAKEAEFNQLNEELKRQQEELELKWNQFEEEANAAREDIQKQAEGIFNEAAENGFNQGHQEGLEQGKAQFDEQIQNARQMIELARQDVIRRIEEAEPDILELSIATAARILGNELNYNDQNWIGMVKKAIYEVREQEEIKVYVPPHWYPVTLQGQPELQEVAVQVGELIVLPDEQLEGNQCILETPYGRVDASMDTQLLEIRHALFDVLKAGNGHE